ncbi:MAG: CcdB family protein [Hyphomonadaceae bacterium]
MVASPPHFAVCENLFADRGDVPFLLNVQHPFADVLGTRLAVPLHPAAAVKALVEKALIPIEINGEAYVASVPEMTAVPTAHFGRVVASLDERRHSITNAVDYLVTGV